MQHCRALAPPQQAVLMHALLPSSYAGDSWRTFQGVRVASWISLSSSGQYFWQGVCNQCRLLVSRQYCKECKPSNKPESQPHLEQGICAAQQCEALISSRCAEHPYNDTPEAHAQ